MNDQTRNTPVSVGVYSNAKQIAKGRTDHGQTTCTNMKGSLSRFPSDDSVSIVSEVRSKAHTKSLTLMVSSSSVVLVGQSSIEQGKMIIAVAKKSFLKKYKPIAERQTRMELFRTMLKNRCP